MKVRVGWAVLGFLLLGIFPSLAAPQSRARILPVEEMVQKSETIGVATVQAVDMKKDEQTGIIRTNYSVTFSDVWKGEPTSPMVVWKAGGQIGNIATGIAGQDYTFRIGEQIVVFCHPSKGGDHVAVGIRQGLYRVGSSDDRPLYRVSEYPNGPGTYSDLPLRKLKEQVFRALGRPVDSLTLPPPPPTDPWAPTKAAPSGPSSADASPKTNPASATVPPPAPTSESSRIWGFLGVVGLIAVGAAAVFLRRKSSRAH